MGFSCRIGSIKESEVSSSLSSRLSCGVLALTTGELNADLEDLGPDWVVSISATILKPEKRAVFILQWMYIHEHNQFYINLDQWAFEMPIWRRLLDISKQVSSAAAEGRLCLVPSQRSKRNIIGCLTRLQKNLKPDPA